MKGDSNLWVLMIKNGCIHFSRYVALLKLSGALYKIYTLFLYSVCQQAIGLLWLNKEDLDAQCWCVLPAFIMIDEHRFLWQVHVFLPASLCMLITSFCTNIDICSPKWLYVITICPYEETNNFF